MTHTITFDSGDGIGPEVTAAVVDIIDASDVKVTWSATTRACSPSAKHGSPLTDELIASVRRNKVALKGPVTTPSARLYASM